jgi:hypothetical protein
MWGVEVGNLTCMVIRLVHGAYTALETIPTLLFILPKLDGHLMASIYMVVIS